MVGIKRGRSLLLAMAASLALLLAACGGNGGGEGAQSGGGGLTDLGKKLPSAIQQSKEIKVDSDIAYAPVEFYKEGTQEVQGIDWDLAQALGQKLGVKVTFANTTFDGIIPALKAKRFDFIYYFKAGTSILVKKGNPQGIQSLDDLCGKTIALQKGTSQVDVATEQQVKCKSAGKPAIKILTYDKDTDAQLQLRTGRAVADMNDFPVAAYAAQTVGGGNDFEVVGQQIGAGPYGIAVRKSDTQLRDALQEALKAAIADGAYAKVLQKWNVTAGSLTTPVINGGQ